MVTSGTDKSKFFMSAVMLYWQDIVADDIDLDIIESMTEKQYEMLSRAMVWAYTWSKNPSWESWFIPI